MTFACRSGKEKPRVDIRFFGQNDLAWVDRSTGNGDFVFSARKVTEKGTTVPVRDGGFACNRDAHARDGQKILGGNDLDVK